MCMFSRHILEVAFGPIPELNEPVERIWTDSRSLKPGDLFAAIPGEKFDGHDFIEAAAKAGAAGALISKSKALFKDNLPAEFTLIEVKDTTQALRALAKAYRKTLDLPIFAVAGSNGKTTTKELLAFLLQQIHGPKNIFKTQKSQNSILGIALSLLQIRNEKIAIIEIGIDEPGWMDQHLEVVAPTHGLITNIGEEHLNRLKNLEMVAEEELKLLKYLVATSNGSFAANLDSPWIKKHERPAQSLTYALDQTADIEGSFVSPNILNAFGIKWANKLPGKHNAQNLLAALTAVRLLMPEIDQPTLTNLSKSLQDFSGEAHRSLWLKLKNDIQVFDDCYNANPDSMEQSLQTFNEVSKGCIQHIVLGDMLDLGETSERNHIRILNLALVLGFDRIYLFGPQFKAALQKVPQISKSCTHYDSIEVLGADLKKRVQEGETIFLKGSRGMALERLLQLLA